MSVEEFDISTERRGNYLFLQTFGQVTENSIINLGKFISQICKQENIKKVLIDVRGMQGALSVSELYYAVSQYTLHVGKEIKVAYINPPPEWIPEDDQFSRDVAFNRGGTLELFKTETEALTWLGVD